MVKSIRRIVVMAAFILVFYLLQTTICTWIFPHTAVPNLLLILTLSVGLLRGRIEGMFAGFFCGLVMDIFSGGMLCFYSLIYMYIGYLNGILRKSLVSDLPLLPMLLCGLSEVLYHIYIYIFSFLLRNRLDFTVYLEDVVMPELIVTILAGILFYGMILAANHVLEKKEKEGASKFVS